MHVPASGQMFPFQDVAELASELVGQPAAGATRFVAMSWLVASHVVFPRYRL